MRPNSLLACSLFAVALAGCAVSRPAPPVVVAPAAAPTTATAQAPSVVRTGQIVAIEGAAQSSSGGAGGTTAGSSPTRLTVRFTDGTQGDYDVTQPAAGFRIGEPVSVISNGSTITIMR